MVSVVPPSATEAKKIINKSLVKYIYIGRPSNEERYGTLPRIQINDAFQPVENVGEYVIMERESMIEADKDKMIVSIKADKDVNMGLISDIKQELRRANALRINYSASPGSEEAVFSNF